MDALLSLVVAGFTCGAFELVLATGLATAGTIGLK